MEKLYLISIVSVVVKSRQLCPVMRRIYLCYAVNLSDFVFWGGNRWWLFSTIRQSKIIIHNLFGSRLCSSGNHSSYGIGIHRFFLQKHLIWYRHRPSSSAVSALSKTCKRFMHDHAVSQCSWRVNQTMHAFWILLMISNMNSNGPSFWLELLGPPIFLVLTRL